MAYRGWRAEPIPESRDRWINCAETYANDGQERIDSCERMQKVVDKRWERPTAQNDKRLAQIREEQRRAARNGRTVGGGKVYEKDMVPIPNAGGGGGGGGGGAQLGLAAAQVNPRRMRLPRGVNPRALQQAVAQAVAQAQPAPAAPRQRVPVNNLGRQIVRQNLNRARNVLQRGAARREKQAKRDARAAQRNAPFNNPLMNSPPAPWE